MRRGLIILCALALAALIGFAVAIEAKQPSNDRVWDVSFSRLNTIDTNADGALTIHNLRNFTYATGTIATTSWVDRTANPDDIASVWFFLDLFDKSIPQVGHTFISFRMKDGSAIAFSIEARREANEKYSFIGGFIRDFELQYLWGTERDLIGQRVVYKNERLYMFPLAVSHDQARALMTEFAKETNLLAEKPRWYNTLTANCTNLLARIVNKYQPGALPYDLSWNLTGLADGYLEREGFIATNGASRDAFRLSHDLTKYRNEIAAHEQDDEAAFSDFVRSLLSSSS